jgi:hypothetical protein
MNAHLDPGFVHSWRSAAACGHRVEIGTHPTVSQDSPRFFLRLLRSHLTKSGGATYLSYATSRRSITTFIHLDLIPPPKTDLYPNPYDTPRPRATFPSLKPYSRLHIIPLAAHIITLTFLLLFSVSAFSIYHSSTFYPKVAHIVRQIFI